MSKFTLSVLFPRRKIFFVVAIITLLFTEYKAQSYGPYTAGTVTNVVRSGSTSSVTGLSNLSLDDGVYASNATNLGTNNNFSDYLNATNFGFALPATATVAGIELDVQRRDLNGKCKDDVVQLLKANALVGTGQPNASAWPAADADVLFGGSSNLWGTTWTVSDINNTGFGVALAWLRSGGGASTAFGQIDIVTLKVYYTNSSVLPVELDEFTGQCINGQKVYVQWRTASEFNNNYFTLERSKDAVTFAPVYTVTGLGSSSTGKAYSFEDSEAAAQEEIYYYRLKQNDFDPGKFKLYNAIAVNCLGGDQKDVSVYPNPFTNSFRISKSSSAQNAFLLDAFGNKIFIDPNAEEINMADKPRGVYILGVQSGSGLKTFRVVHQ